MSTPDFKRALDRMETVITNWFMTDFMILTSWTMIEKRPSPAVKTMGLDTRNSPAILLYNPNFINSLDNETLEMVMASEGLKILLRHATTRLKHPRDISALSSSITVDQLMLKDQEAIAFKDIMPMPANYGLPNDTFYEDYYRRLNENLDDSREKMEKQFGKSASQKEKEELEKEQKKQEKEKQKKEKKEPSQESEEGGDSGEEKESQQGEPKKGKKKPGQNGEPSDEQGGSGAEEGEPSEEGDGSPGDYTSENGQPKEEYKDFKDSKEAMKDHMDPRNDNNKFWGENDMLDAEVQNMVDEYKGSSNKWGKHSGNAMSNIVAANTPKISYKEVIKRFNTSVTTSKQESTRLKFNRRFGLDAPGRKRVYTTKILFALDVSGSMSDEDIAEGFAVVNSCCKHAEVHWMTFDTEIHDIATKMKKAQNMFKVNGRGGTEPAPVLAYADEHKYDGVIIYSDMDFYSQQKRPHRAKVLWLGSTKSAKNPTDFGYWACLDRNSRW